MRALWAGLVVASLLLGVLPAAAHPLAPGALELVLDEAGAEVRWRVTALQPEEDARPSPPPGCTEGDASHHLAGAALVATTRWDCPDGLVGRALQGPTDGDLWVVTVLYPGGSTRRATLGPGSEPLVFDAPAGPWAEAWAFGVVGLDHLLGGPDHALLVTALVLLLGWGRPLLLALLAFTAGHAITLGLAVAGQLRVASGPVEAAIAASLVWAALEVLRRAPEGAPPGPMARWPVLVPLGVGLVHGLGFAGALAEIGLPEGALVRALAAFHFGLELGQVLVAAAVLALLRVAPPSAARAMGWIVGLMGSMWLWVRVCG